MADGNGRILSLDQVGRNAKDDQGRVLRHNATVLEAHQIAIEEGNKVHEFYMNQIPPFVARMIQDALMSYGLIKLTDEAQLAATAPDPTPVPDGVEGPPPTDPAEALDRPVGFVGELVGDGEELRACSCERDDCDICGHPTHRARRAAKEKPVAPMENTAP